jgi:hypothetical protein
VRENGRGWKKGMGKERKKRRENEWKEGRMEENKIQHGRNRV